MVFESEFVDARCFLLIVSSGAYGFLSCTTGGSCLSFLFWVEELDSSDAVLREFVPSLWSLSGVVLTSMKFFNWRAKDLLTGLVFRL